MHQFATGHRLAIGSHFDVPRRIVRQRDQLSPDKLRQRGQVDFLGREHELQTHRHSAEVNIGLRCGFCGALGVGLGQLHVYPLFSKSENAEA
ncbi:hypothetical protein D3C76_1204890 [compost metagenome]